MPLQFLFLFCLAGAMGTLARYGLTVLFTLLFGCTFPWSVFLVNILGCFLFGSVWAAAGLLHLVGDTTRLIILTGFMGAFTTFSTFIFDAHTLLAADRWLALCFQTVGQVLLGLIALRLGIRMVSFFAAMPS